MRKEKMSEFRVGIIGSRSVTDYGAVLSAICEARLQGFIPMGEFIVVSGGAQGVDSFARKFSQDSGYRLIEYKPDYSTGKGRAAPLIRNSIIAENSNVLIAIHDGKSTGTMHMINCMKKLGKPVYIKTI